MGNTFGGREQLDRSEYGRFGPAGREGSSRSYFPSSLGMPSMLKVVAYG